MKYISMKISVTDYMRINAINLSSDRNAGAIILKINGIDMRISKGDGVMLQKFLKLETYEKIIIFLCTSFTTFILLLIIKQVIKQGF